jgi:uroporphyrin-III C-methyltransferase
MAVPDLAVHRPGPLPGWVYLVGAGPGDPELFTLRGARLVAGADVIVYDNLVAPPILDLAPASAERIYVGKKAADHSLPQDEINLLLLKLARREQARGAPQGRRPLHLRPWRRGDGAAGRRGRHVEVVPGVTAAAGVSAYAGIPLTHREHAQSVVFATGFLKEGKIDLDWPMLARPQPDRGDLHGHLAPGRHLRAARRPRPAGEHARGGDRARHHPRAARGGGRPRHPGRSACWKKACARPR